ncbi:MULTISPECIES: hypothetical protein [unclassified Dysgonomonas]|uniref:hypothetical protein n=1 Tax=unclassified Dysgonomonas TaxID=2630389 RepID=UPI0025C354AE|nr:MULTISPECIES: hypothetical protein [unclassified Dysgonomonas]HMM02019.1 hypothetical protein [Dysgonomonas sp.]
MKEICLYFDIIPLSNVEYVDRNNISMLNDKLYDRFYADSLNINVTSDSSEAGDAWSVSETVSVDKVTNDIAIRYSYLRSSVLIVYYSDGSRTIYGSPQYPVMVLLTREQQKDSLKFSLTTTVSPII